MENTKNTTRLTTHRLIQVAQLEDTLSTSAISLRRAADNLARINNDNGAGHYLRRAMRLEKIAEKCLKRLKD